MTHTNENTRYSERCKKAALAFEMYKAIAPDWSDWVLRISCADAYDVTVDDMITYTETADENTETADENTETADENTETADENTETADENTETADWIKMMILTQNKAKALGITIDEYLQFCDEYDHTCDDGWYMEKTKSEFVAERAGKLKAFNQ